MALRNSLQLMLSHRRLTYLTNFQSRKGWDLVGSSASFEVGDGKRVKFWKDKWCGDVTLASAVPSLFAFTLSKEVWVTEVWDDMGEGGHWNPHFIRHLNDWELDNVEDFFLRIQGKSVKDRVLQMGSRKGVFCVTSFDSLLEPGHPTPSPVAVIWNSLILSKVSFSAWKAS